MTALYRHFDKDGVLLYVGISCNAMRRTEDHSKNSEWFGDVSSITIEMFETRSLAIEAEKNAIKKEKPMHNVVFNSARARRGEGTQSTMKKQDAIKEFGGARYLAIALGISVQAVHKWGDDVPPGRVDQINAARSQSAPPDPQT